MVAVNPYSPRYAPAKPKAPLVKLTARITEWDVARDRGHIKFERHRVPIRGQDFLIRHKRPEVGDVVEFRISRDPAEGLCAVEVEHLNEGARIRWWHLAVILPFLVTPLYALSQVLRSSDWPIAGGYLFAVSVVSLLAYRFDKMYERKGRIGVSDSVFHTLALLGGWPGAFIAQRKYAPSRGIGFHVFFWMIVLLHHLVAIEYLRGWVGLNTINLWFMHATMPVAR
jgi:uncharacterized membrane protein YsdA (DUF1294 family)